MMKTGILPNQMIKQDHRPDSARLEDAFHVFNDNNYALNAQAYLNITFMKSDLKMTGAGEFTGFSKNTFTEFRDFGPVQVEPATFKCLCRHNAKPDV